MSRRVSVVGQESGSRMGLHVLPHTIMGRTLALLFALVGSVFWLGEQGVRVFGIVFPGVHWGWWAAPAVGALVLMRQEPDRAPAGRDALVALTVLVMGIPLVALQHGSRAPLSPMVARVQSASEEADAGPRVPLDALRLDRQGLWRLVGRPRDVRLLAEGVLFVPESGEYEFRLRADDQASLTIGTRSVFVDSAGGEARVALDGGWHPVVLGYRQTTGDAHLRLTWRTPGVLELLPLENHLGASPQAVSADDLGRQTRRVAIGLVAILVWTVLGVLLLFRAGESRTMLVRQAVLWLREPRDPVVVRSVFWAACAAACFLASLSVEDSLPRLARLARVLYASETERIPLAVARHEAYVHYFRVLAMLCGAVGGLFLIPATARERVWSPSRAHLLALLFVGTAAALVGGAFLSHRAWDGMGRPCWDWYCLYATHIRDALRSPDAASLGALRAHLDANFHANSPVGPLLTAVAGLGVPDIPTAYRLVSAVASLATLPVVYRLARHHLGLDTVASWVAVLLFVSSSQVQRSLLFTQTDPLVMLFFSAAFERLLSLRAHVSTRAATCVILLATLALLTKLSALPLVAVIGLVLMIGGAPTSPMQRLLRAGLVALLPVAAFAGFMAVAGTLPNYAIELGRRATSDSRPGLHVIAAASSLLPLALAFLVDPRRLELKETPFALAIVLYLAGLWGSGGSGWERFYLVILPLALPLAVKRLASVPALRRPLDAAALLALFALAHALRLLVNVYY
jgi:hypothetical protein